MSLYTLEELKSKNEWFDFSNYKLTDIFKGSFENDCLVSENGNFHIIWIDICGKIINKSLDLSMKRLKAIKTVDKLENEILNMKCKPIDRNMKPFEIHREWDKRYKIIKQKEKGIRRLLIKSDKLYDDQMRIAHFNFLLRKEYGKVL